MFEKIHTDTTAESPRPDATEAVRLSSEQPLQKKREIVENKRKEQEHVDREKKLDQDLDTTFKKISSSLKNKIAAAEKDVERIQADSKKQWLWERMGSNSESQITEFQGMADGASALLSRLEEGYSYAQLSIYPEKKVAFLHLLEDFTKVDDHGVPIMDAEGQFVSELLRNKPNFAKLQNEYESMEYGLNLAEQGLQYSQTVLEIAASYAGPPGIAASLIPKYIIQLSTGQSTPTNIALQVFEDIVSSYIGSGKVAKAVLQKLGPYAGKLIEAFQSSEKSGWTKNAIKSAIVQCIEIFRDKELQNIFAWGKEQVTGEEAQYMSFQEVAGGQILGKAIGKGLDRSGVGGAISKVANGGRHNTATDTADGASDVAKPSSGEELVYLTDRMNPFTQSMQGSMETAKQRNLGKDSSQNEASPSVEKSSPAPEEFKSRQTTSDPQRKEQATPAASKDESETPFYSRRMNPYTDTARQSVKKAQNPKSKEDSLHSPAKKSPAPSQTVLQQNLSIPDSPEGRKVRIGKAMEVLGQTLGVDKKTAILQAHNVPMTGSDPVTGNARYSHADLKQKAKILETAGFSHDERRLLIEQGICGLPPPPGKQPRKLPSLPNYVQGHVSPPPTVKPQPPASVPTTAPKYGNGNLPPPPRKQNSLPALPKYPEVKLPPPPKKKNPVPSPIHQKLNSINARSTLTEDTSKTYRQTLAKDIQKSDPSTRRKRLDDAKSKSDYWASKEHKIKKLRTGEKINDGLGIKYKKITLYHGSRVPNITELKLADDYTIGKGLYLTSEANTAVSYAHTRSSETPVIYEVSLENVKFLDLTNDQNIKTFMEGFRPFAINAYNKQDNYFAKQSMANGISAMHSVRNGELKNVVGGGLSNSVAEYAASLGYDGLIGLEGGEGFGNHDSWVVFDPKKVSILQSSNLQTEKPKDGND